MSTLLTNAVEPLDKATEEARIIDECEQYLASFLSITEQRASSNEFQGAISSRAGAASATSYLYRAPGQATTTTSNFVCKDRFLELSASLVSSLLARSRAHEMNGSECRVLIDHTERALVLLKMAKDNGLDEADDTGTKNVEYLESIIIRASIVRLFTSTTAPRADPAPALSYVWGDDTKVSPIIVNGTTVHVTVSLHAALRRLRHATEPRCLWADALCINQADLDEKKHQIALMQHIYAGAKEVAMWLGDPCQATTNVSVECTPQFLSDLVDILPLFASALSSFLVAVPVDTPNGVQLAADYALPFGFRNTLEKLPCELLLQGHRCIFWLFPSYKVADNGIEHTGTLFDTCSDPSIQGMYQHLSAWFATAFPTANNPASVDQLDQQKYRKAEFLQTLYGGGSIPFKPADYITLAGKTMAKNEVRRLVDWWDWLSGYTPSMLEDGAAYNEWDRMGKEHAMVQHARTTFIRHKRFFVTRDGQFGIGPSSFSDEDVAWPTVLEGDEILVVHGSVMPVILRRIQSKPGRQFKQHAKRQSSDTSRRPPTSNTKYPCDQDLAAQSFLFSAPMDKCCHAADKVYQFVGVCYVQGLSVCELFEEHGAELSTIHLR